MAPKVGPAAILFAFVVLSSVAAQTFQYSRGWTNGKRDGHRRAETDMREIASNLERVLSPCQLAKLHYVLEGKPLNDRLLEPCAGADEDNELLKPRYKSDHPAEPVVEAYL